MKITKKQLNLLIENYLLGESIVSLLPALSSFLVGCKSEKSPSLGEAELFRLGNSIPLEKIQSYSFFDTINDNEKNYLENAASNNMLFSGDEFELGPFYMHEREKITHESTSFGKVAVMIQFSCIPFNNKVYYVANNQEIVLVDEKLSSIHADHLEDDTSQSITGFDSSGYQDMSRLGTPNDQYLALVDFEYINIDEEEFIIFDATKKIRKLAAIQKIQCKKDHTYDVDHTDMLPM